MNEMKVYSITKREKENPEIKIVIAPACRAGLKNLQSYSHMQRLSWMKGYHHIKDQGTLVANRLSTQGPKSYEENCYFEELQ